MNKNKKSIIKNERKVCLICNNKLKDIIKLDNYPISFSPYNIYL